MQEDKIMFETPGKFVSIKKCANHQYFYAERLGVDSVAFILYNKDTEKIGIIKEYKPPFECFMETAFGGSIDKNHVKKYQNTTNSEEKISITKDIVQQEVLEEAGFKVDIKNIEFNRKVLVSTQMNQMCYLFTVYVNNSQEVERQPENDMEAIAEVVWIDYKDIDNYLSNVIDWKSYLLINELIK